MTALANAIKKVATGPHLSKDLTFQETQEAITEILSGQADPVQAAIFFISLRIKRETNEENLGVYAALQAVTKQVEADVDQLLLIADPFNGFNRHCPINAFLPAVLAASGLPTVSHGVEEMGPKFGVTHSQVLSEAGINTSLTTGQAKDRINQTDIGWAYLDQAQASPALFALQDLRTRMIKRPSLATLEKMVLAIKAKQKTHLQIGFVHKAYPDILAWMANHAGFDSALIIRGIEGGVLPTLREAANCFQSYTEIAEGCTIDPNSFGIKQETRGVLPIASNEVTASETLELGRQALDGKVGPAFDSLVYGTALALWHCRLSSSQAEAANHARQAIKSGKAKAHFQAAVS